MPEPTNTAARILPAAAARGVVDARKLLHGHWLICALAGASIALGQGLLVATKRLMYQGACGACAIFSTSVSSLKRSPSCNVENG
jgi:hypothetical protein